MVDSLVHKEKMPNCHGCAIQHPSHRQHSCLMMDGEDAWMYYYDNVVKKIDLSLVLKTAESVCTALGTKLEKTSQWEAYVTTIACIELIMPKDNNLQNTQRDPRDEKGKASFA